VGRKFTILGLRVVLQLLNLCKEDVESIEAGFNNVKKLVETI
jgi:hypothetical protein